MLVSSVGWLEKEILKIVTKKSVRFNLVKFQVKMNILVLINGFMRLHRLYSKG